MKASTLKKLNLIIEEANAFKDKNKFQKAISKLNQALNFINIKVSEPEDKKIEIENIKNAINQTYSVEISTILEEGVNLKKQRDFTGAENKFHQALKMTDKIDDVDLQIAEKTEINNLLSENDIEQLIEKGLILREQKKFDEALNIFNQGLSIAEGIQDPNSRGDQLSFIKKEIKKTNETQLKSMIENGKQLKQTGQIYDAIEVFENSLNFIGTFFDPGTMENQTTNIKNLLNEIYSDQINPIIEKGKELISQKGVERAISEFRNALSITKKMYTSDIKNLKLNHIAETLNPIYIEQIKPILEKGEEILKKEKYEESISTIKEAVEILTQALDIAQRMVDSGIKDREIKKISDLINQPCLAGIKIIKDRSIQLIVQKKYDDAISEIYIALSLAKLMAYPEDENEELENLKNLVNKVYSAEIKEVLDRGDKFLEQKEYDKAIETYNEALSMTNKMYLTDEMEKEVNMIKSLIYETEVKQLVGAGKLLEEQKLKENEIEKLKKRLEYAQSIEDSDRRTMEMNKVKKMIDDVHSDEIKLLIEQGNQLADLKKYENAFKYYERALKVNEIMETPDIKNKDLIKDTYKKELINNAKLEIENKEFENAIESCKRALELDNGFVDAYYYLGISFNKKKSYDAAIENLEKAVELDKNHFHSWNQIGLAYDAKQDYDNALKNLTKSIEISPNFSEGWYNIGNLYKEIKNFNKAIESYTKATDLDTDFAKAWFFMGCAFFDKKDYYNAIQNIEKAIKIDPSLTENVRNLIRNLKNSIDELKEALSMSFINR
ncbi:MAG: tetratricopeptide repeat protein [Promethearchaeota archaeon]